MTESSSVHNLTFMFVTSFGQSGFNASGVVPAADIALEDINNHPDVLQGYHLMYDEVRDSQVCTKPDAYTVLYASMSCMHQCDNIIVIPY